MLVCLFVYMSDHSLWIFFPSFLKFWNIFLVWFEYSLLSGMRFKGKKTENFLIPMSLQHDGNAFCYFKIFDQKGMHYKFQISKGYSTQRLENQSLSQTLGSFSFQAKQGSQAFIYFSLKSLVFLLVFIVSWFKLN